MMSLIFQQVTETLATEAQRQEAQLSQGNRAKLRVIEYFAATQGYSIRSFEMTVGRKSIISTS